eukprot:9196130-Lingulodinium_polyedra.AAC.1
MSWGCCALRGDPGTSQGHLKDAQRHWMSLGYMLDVPGMSLGRHWGVFGIFSGCLWGVFGMSS